MALAQDLPKGVTVFERGWLSANNILFRGEYQTALVDTGYWTHSGQTVALVRHALGPRPLNLVLNTHLHSDHCGGNAALQAQFPSAKVLIPPGMAEQVRNWDATALSYVSTGQHCPRFRTDGLLQPGAEINLADLNWQIHAAPGHDPHSIVLFEPGSRTLISADALWENGFGVVFQELEGDEAFFEVSATLDLIESLAPRVVIPGHGKVFSEVATALAAARRRLDSFVRDPLKHVNHAAKVLVKFKLLELQRVPLGDLVQWATATPYFRLVHSRWFAGIEQSQWIEQIVTDLARSGAAQRDGDWVIDA